MRCHLVATRRGLARAWVFGVAIAPWLVACPDPRRDAPPGDPSPIAPEPPVDLGDAPEPPADPGNAPDPEPEPEPEPEAGTSFDPLSLERADVRIRVYLYRRRQGWPMPAVRLPAHLPVRHARSVEELGSTEPRSTH